MHRQESTHEVVKLGLAGKALPPGWSGVAKECCELGRAHWKATLLAGGTGLGCGWTRKGESPEGKRGTGKEHLEKPVDNGQNE